MPTYTFSQLEQLWTNAGGSSAMAPIMAAIALAESSGNSDAVNYNDSNGEGGTQTSWGLWQISNGTHSAPVPNITDPTVNAEQAVIKLSTQGITAWGTYTSGLYQQFLQGGGQSVTTPDQPTTTASSTPGSSLNPSDALNEAKTIFNGLASALNWGFWLFEPGQGWRFAFGVGGVVSGVGAAKLYMSPNVQQEKSSAFPTAILLTGISFLCLYMTLRAWPVNSEGKAVRPAAYAAMILTGQKPPAGPPPPDNTELIAGGLEALTSVWIVSKIAGSIGNIAGAAGILGSIWAGIKGIISGGPKEPGGGIPDIPDVALTLPDVPGLSTTQTD